MPGRGSKVRRIKRMKAKGDYQIEWYRPYPAKTAGVCTRCREGYAVDAMINGDYKWPMHSECWDKHLKERRPNGR